MKQPFFPYILPFAFVVAACDPGEKESPVHAADYAEESDPPTLRVPPTEEPPQTDTAPQFEELTEDNAAALLDELLHDPDRRYLLKAFFETLSERDPALALELLPENLNYQEQRDWAVPIAAGLMRIGDSEKVADVLNSLFTGGARSAAIVACIESFPDSTSAEEAIRFWALLDEEGTSDRASGSLASFLVPLDPVRAVEWFESLNSQVAKRHALEFMVGSDRDAITRQLEMAEDTQLRRKLAGGLGTALIESNVDLSVALEQIQSLPAAVVGNAQSTFAKGFGYALREKGFDQAGAIEELRKLPQGMIPEAESAYVDTITRNVSGKIDFEALESYVAEGFTHEGKDRAQMYLAWEEFSSNPEKGVGMFLETGVSERQPDHWGVIVTRWLNLDAGAASEYVLDMNAGSTRDLAIKEIISHLEESGDQEAIDAWKGEFTEGGRLD